MDAYIVIGDADSFKSSTVRSLTGCRVRGVRNLVRGGVVLPTYVQLSSLQEGSLPIQPRDFIATVSNARAKAAIFPLRANPHLGRPDANAYIQEFIKAGWKMKGIALLHSPGFQLTVPKVPKAAVFSYPSAGSPHYFANDLASKVRQDFGWT